MHGIDGGGLRRLNLPGSAGVAERMRSAEQPTLSPGAQIVVRDTVWKVVNVRTSQDLKHILDVVGLSPLVRDRAASFVREIEEIQVLSRRGPGWCRTTRRIIARACCGSKRCCATPRLAGSTIAIGHRAAMDVLDFQLEPARVALAKPFQRILIADAVGLGKTLEAGILCAELIRRGRGRRILVATTKSMLEQLARVRPRARRRACPCRPRSSCGRSRTARESATGR